MPKACGRPPKKAQTTNEGEPQPWPPSPPCTTLTPISDGSAIKARNTKYCVSEDKQIYRYASIERKDLSFSTVINIVYIFADEDILTAFYSVMLFAYMIFYK
jgi:hypothetical protein